MYSEVLAINALYQSPEVQIQFQMKRKPSATDWCLNHDMADTSQKMTTHSLKTQV